MIHLPGNGGQRGMGAMLHWILPELAAYVAVVVAAGLLFLAGASVYALMWPKPVVPFGQWVLSGGRGFTRAEAARRSHAAVSIVSKGRHMSVRNGIRSQS